MTEAEAFAEALADFAPPGRAASLAKTKVDECLLWAGAAIEGAK